MDERLAAAESDGRAFHEKARVAAGTDRPGPVAEPVRVIQIRPGMPDRPILLTVWTEKTGG